MENFYIDKEIGSNNNSASSNMNFPNSLGRTTLLIDAGCSPWDPRC